MKTHFHRAAAYMALLLIPFVTACTGTVVNPQGEVVDNEFVRTTALALDRANDSLVWFAGEVKRGVEAGLITPEKRDELMDRYDEAVEMGKQADQALVLYEGFPTPDNQEAVNAWLADFSRFIAELLLEVDNV